MRRAARSEVEAWLEADKARRAEYHRLALEIGPIRLAQGMATGFVVCGAAGIGLLLTTALDLAGVRWNERVLASFVALAMPTGIAMVFLFGMAYEVQRRGIERRLLARMRVCPSCLYDLDAGRADETGRCVCPECGASWRLERA